MAAGARSPPGGTWMDRRLLQAAMSGDAASIKHLVAHDPDMLLATTPRGNTCLHIASIHGHEGFCKHILALHPSLLAAVNAEGETPLINAVTSNHDSLASSLLRCSSRGEYGLLSLSDQAILKRDKDGSNALHHAIRSGHEELALQLIAAEPALSRAVNEYGESPMFIAVMRDFMEIVDRLLEIPGSADGGTYGSNVLHAAVRRGNKDIIAKIIEIRPGLARGEETTETTTSPQLGEENKPKDKAKRITPMQLAVRWNKIDELTVMLDHDWSLGYQVSSSGVPLLLDAAFGGHIAAAQVLLNRCPDAPCCNAEGWTCLHQAVWHGRTDFVHFILKSPQLRKLVNMRKSNGKTALHYAVQKCNPAMVRALISHKYTDFTMFDREYKSAVWKLFDAGDHAKTLNWNEIFMYMMEADPKDTTSISNVNKAVTGEVTDASRKNVKSLTETYTNNTSLVAILMATITFAAAFTLPGGSSDEGLPIMARKSAFQAFLIFDTLAMCSSLAVAFICIIARWEDLEFLLHYRSFTKKLMWFAYMATTIAFATGLYTVLVPRLQRLAIAVCVMSVLLPVLTYVLGKWPVLKLRIQFGRNFKSDFLDMV